MNEEKGNEMGNEKGTIEIADLYLVTFLTLEGHQYQIHRNGDYITFRFKVSEQLSRSLAAFHLSLIHI